jgi:hypothetical protein
MNKEKLKEIHSKRFLSDRFKEVNFEDQNNLQFFLANYELNGKTIIEGKCFTNKSFNSWWYYRFKSVEQFKERCLKQIESNNERQESKKKYQEERTKPHSLKIGDILYCSWGYDQTQVDYFKVSEIIGKRKIKIVGLGTNAESDGIHDKATPHEGGGNHWTKKQYYCEIDKKWKTKNLELVKFANSNNSVKISSFAYAYLWDGKPKYQTNAYMGH